MDTKPTHLLHGLWPVVVEEHEQEALVWVTYVGPDVPGNRKLGERRSASRFDFDGRPNLVRYPRPEDPPSDLRESIKYDF